MMSVSTDWWTVICVYEGCMQVNENQHCLCKCWFRLVCLVLEDGDRFPSHSFLAMMNTILYVVCRW